MEYNYRQLLSGFASEMESDIEIAIVCERMHWTYQDYLSQPVDFIEVLKLKWRLDNEHQDKLHRQSAESAV